MFFTKLFQKNTAPVVKNKEYGNLSRLPESISSRMALVDGVLHISEELKSNMHMMDFVTEQKRRGNTQVRFYSALEFTEKFQHDTVATVNVKDENELKTFAKSIFQKAYEQKASDIHIKDLGTHSLIRFRIIGMVVDYNIYQVEKGRALLQGIYNTMCQRSETMYNNKERQDARIVERTNLPREVHSIRVHSESTDRPDAPEGIASCMYLRLLYDAIKATGTLEQRLDTLGFLPEQIEIFKYLMRRTGLVIVSGPTGHGKSTVLKHCMESMVEQSPQKNYIAFEDPSEYVIEGVDQISISTKDNNRGRAYTEAIAGGMRSDPDTILIGEMRYAEAIIAGMNVATSGHAVWASFHASGAFNIISRMVTLLTDNGTNNALDQLCEPNVLAGLEYQRLIPILCPHCSKKFLDVKDSYDTGMAEQLYKIMNVDNVRVTGEGCHKCNNLGRIGQLVVAEVIATDTKMLQLIKQKDFEAAKEYFVKSKKGITHVQHALWLIEQGMADPIMAEERIGLPLDLDGALEVLRHHRIIPVLCPSCSKSLLENIDNFDTTMLEKLKGLMNIDKVRIEGDGCEECRNLGTIGHKIIGELNGKTNLQHALMLIKQGMADPFITEDRLGLPLDIEGGLDK